MLFRLFSAPANIERRVDEIAANHLPHIYERLGHLEGRQSLLIVGMVALLGLVGTVLGVVLAL